MGSYLCTLPLILLLAISMLVLGFINVFRKDSAWQIAEWAYRNVKPQRTPAWERDSTIRGVILLVSGLLLLIWILYLLFCC